MNRSRLRRYALRAVAAVSLGIGVAVVAGGIASADTTPTTYGKVLPVSSQFGAVSTTEDTSWT
jgi:hypothetical protein